jgi:hypothetical protein
MGKKKNKFDVYQDKGKGVEKLPEVDITIESREIKATQKTLKWPELPPDYKPGLQNKPDDFIVYHHTKPKKEYNSSGTSVSVLPELIGLPWNEITMCYVLALDPSAVRVSSDCVTADSYPNRITVMVNNLTDRLITSITMEVDIPCPENYCGYDLQLHLNKLRKGDKTPYKTIHERSKESPDGSVQIGPGMWIGMPMEIKMPSQEEWQDIFDKKPPEEK